MLRRRGSRDVDPETSADDVVRYRLERRGAFAYACRLVVPVVPMVFTYGRRSRWRPRPPLRLTILPAERPRGAGPADVVELMTRCRAAMEAVVLESRGDVARW
ncbi:hypothetical protein [Cellulosimicrobium sp. Marseille-Q4280]|uniref:hypothetical protein n=1 Tax=Cellulosimicrobium sp. Marseille-Q4280 TaxID=2937992 RepID=UPI00203AC4B6|nr:hypothetical protein [Cellulosimicrobium sp. Marseille-Q4280]